MGVYLNGIGREFVMNNYTYQYNEPMNDYEVFKKDTPTDIYAVFKSSDHAQQWVDILEGRAKVVHRSDIGANVWKESYIILLSESKREWRVLNYNYERVAIFRHGMDAYVWVDLATGRYSLERRDN